MAMILFALAAMAQPQAILGEDALRAGAPVVRQWLDESIDAWFRADPDRTTFFVTTRPRGTGVGGICASDRVMMVMAPPAAPAGAPGARPARIRELGLSHQFHVLRSEADDPAPRWDVAADALEAACAGMSDHEFHWIEADSVADAQAAVRGLLAVKAALGRPDSPRIRARCPGRNCFNRAAMAALIRPLDFFSVIRSDSSRCGGGERYRCQLLFVSDPQLCGGWELLVQSDWDEPFRLRAATFIQRAGIMIHCNGEDS